MGGHGQTVGLATFEGSEHSLFGGHYELYQERLRAGRRDSR